MNERHAPRAKTNVGMATIVAVVYGKQKGVQQESRNPQLGILSVRTIMRYRTAEDFDERFGLIRTRTP